MSDDAIRALARNIGLVPEVSGHANVQDAIAAGGGGGGIGNDWIMANQTGDVLLTGSEAPVDWVVQQSEGSPGFTLNVDTQTWDCGTTGLYIIYVEPVLAYVPNADSLGTVVGIQAEVRVRPTLADGNALGNFLNLHWTYDFLPTIATASGLPGIAIAPQDYESYTLPPMQFAAGDSFQVTAMVLVPSGSTDTVTAKAAHAISISKVG